MKKPEILLLLFYRLYKGDTVYRSAFCRETKIAERTFFRYLVNIKNFVIDNMTGLDIVSGR